MTSLPNLIRWIEQERVFNCVGAIVERREGHLRRARARRKNELICTAIAEQLRKHQVAP
jgi:hypothetical protein